jgi:hypothetical protein
MRLYNSKANTLNRKLINYVLSILIINSFFLKKNSYLRLADRRTTLIEQNKKKICLAGKKKITTTPLTMTAYSLAYIRKDKKTCSYTCVLFMLTYYYQAIK